jgi:hypothetical protein
MNRPQYLMSMISISAIVIVAGCQRPSSSDTAPNTETLQASRLAERVVQLEAKLDAFESVYADALNNMADHDCPVITTTAVTG